MLLLKPIDHGRGKGADSVILNSEDIVGGELQAVIQEGVVAFHGCVRGPFSNITRANDKAGLCSFATICLGPGSACHGVHRIHKGMKPRGVTTSIGVLIRPSEERERRSVLLSKAGNGQEEAKQQGRCPVTTAIALVIHRW